jgi:hypothetical protein
MKAFLALALLAVLGLAVSYVQLICFNFLYHKELKLEFSALLSESLFLFTLNASVTADHDLH